MSDTSLKAFFASPFADAYRWIRDAIASACRQHDVELRAVDEIVTPGTNIIMVIHQEIEAADFAFAVLTDQNPNVFYELGRLLQASKPTIMLAENSTLAMLPFDVRAFSVMGYSSDPGTAAELTASVGSEIGKVRNALNPGTRTTATAGHAVAAKSASLAAVKVLDFEQIRRDAEAMLGKADCSTVDIKNYDTDSFKGWNQTIDCPCGDTLLVVVDLNGDITRVRKK